MSHKATHWLANIDPEQITHAEFRVLFHLCDCHNPSHGCFPKQSYLLRATGLSNGGLNKALSELEAKGLIARERRYDGAEKKRLPTMYALAFEPDFKAGTDAEQSDDLTPLSGDSPNSTESTDLTPLRAQTYLHSGGDSIDEPVNEPVNEPVTRGRAKFDFSFFLGKFFAAYPRGGDRDTCEDLLRRAIDEDGIDPDHILAAVRAYASEVRDRHAQYIAYPENWLGKRRWEDHKPKVASTPDEIAAFWVPRLKAGNPVAVKTISKPTVQMLIAGEFITEAECREAGVL